MLNMTSLHGVDPRGRAVYDVGLLPLACWNRKFETAGGKDVYIL